MQFGRFPVAGAAGAILAHGLRQGAISFRKGRVLSAEDVAALIDAGIPEVTIAWLEPGDVAEDVAATRVAGALAQDEAGVRIGAAFTGRANLYARVAGLVVLDADKVRHANGRDEAITIATLPPFAKVAPGEMLATIKIIPFAAREESVAAIETLLATSGGLRVQAFQPRQAALISTRLPGMKPSLLDKNRQALEARLEPLG